MTHDDIRALFDQQERINASYPNERREATPNIVRYISQTQPFSFILYTHADETDIERIIDEQIAYFAGIGHGFEWKTYSHDTPPDLVERLARRGFVTEERETVMVLDLESPPPALVQPLAHDIRRISDTRIIRDILYNVQRVVFHDDDAESQRHIESFVASIEQSPDQVAFYAAFIDDQPVSAAWISFAPGSDFAGLWAGATLEGYRGRGLYTALLAARAQEALRRERRFLYIDASPMSRPIVAKHGFFELTTTIPCEWKPAES